MSKRFDASGAQNRHRTLSAFSAVDSLGDEDTVLVVERLIRDLPVEHRAKLIARLTQEHAQEHAQEPQS